MVKREYHKSPSNFTEKKMKTLTFNKQISVNNQVSVVALKLNIEQFDCGDFSVNALAVLNTNVDWMELPWDLMDNICSVTKSVLVESFPSLKDAKVTFSEQGRQFTNAMDMDVFFETKDAKGSPEFDDARTNEVFAKI